MYASPRAVHEELGRRVRIATVGSIIAAEIEQLAGQPQEAVSILRWAYETVNEMGAMSATATIAGFFGQMRLLSTVKSARRRSWRGSPRSTRPQATS